MNLVRLSTKRTLSIIFVCTIVLLIKMFDYTLNNIPHQTTSAAGSAVTSSSSLLSKTCLLSYDSSQLRRSVFRSSIVHYGIPPTVDYWVENKTGFEIGGPSVEPWGNFGVYDHATKVDVANFAANTLWESGLKDGSPFIWNKRPKGIQYIRDAVDLTGIPTEFYDFVLACDVIEHIANPFKALLEWIRILRPAGFLLIIAPFTNVTFDHKRNVNRIEHLIDDYHNKTAESDLSHLEEILRQHDLQKDPPAGNIEAFKSRSEKNFENRALHQHVYDQELLYYIYICLGLNVNVQYTWSYHQLIIGQKK